MWAEKIHLNLSTLSEPVITLHLNKEGNGHFPGGSQWLRFQATTARVPHMVRKLPWPVNAGEAGLIPGLWRFPKEGNDNPLQYFCPGNAMDRGAWWATVHGVTKESDETKWPNHLTYWKLSPCMPPSMAKKKKKESKEKFTFFRYCIQVNFKLHFSRKSF